ncbi:MAG TPA: hypothetical protein VHX38_02225 [Pseudonocardiaceae bacterium]|jgi:hypothetical protein|nr:hypothetical protein [Pseudonocardiaceae bacterium]
MSLDRTTLRFPSPRAAERWFDQLREQWVVTGTQVEPDPVVGGVQATAEFATANGALVPADV